MDLKDLDTTAACEHGFELELLHPITGKPLGMFVTVLGRDSDVFTKVQNDQARVRMQKAQRMGQKATFTLEDIDRETIDLLAACTVSWRRIVSDGGQKGQEVKTLLVDGSELECNKANAVQLYTRFKWVREQVDVAVMDRANFLKR
jgi:hypothetical protein